MYLIYSIVPLFYNKNVSECTVFRPKYLTGPTTLDLSRTPSSVPGSVIVFVQAGLYCTVLYCPTPSSCASYHCANESNPSRAEQLAFAEILILVSAATLSYATLR